MIIFKRRLAARRNHRQQPDPFQSTAIPPKSRGASIGGGSTAAWALA